MRGAQKIKRFADLGCAPAPWTAESNALGEIVLTCHDTDADGKPWSEDFAQSWGATAEAVAKAYGDSRLSGDCYKAVVEMAEKVFAMTRQETKVAQTAMDGVWTETWCELHLEHNGHLLLLQRSATLEDARHALALRKGCDKCKDNVYRILKVAQTTEVVE